MKPNRFWIALCGLLAILPATPGASAQTTPVNIPTATAKAPPFPVEVLVKGPADTTTELQVICLFRSGPSNTLQGSLIEMNQKLKGLLDRVRQPSLFAGELGETLLIAPAPGTIVARRLLIVGLGDSQTFNPARMNLVGAIVFSEANRLGVKHPFFAPTVLDGGVSGFPTGDVAEQFMRGFLRARDTARTLQAAGQSPPQTIEALTFLAGAAHAADTQAGLARGQIGTAPHQ